MDQVAHIADQLQNAREAYYLGEAPLLSDHEFDVLEEQLREMAPDHPYFATLGTPVREEGKVTHKLPMLSMGKVKNLQELNKWLTRLALPEGTSYCLQPKIDGLSATALYRGGKRQYLATRGDGTIGQDISHALEYMKGIPEKFSSSLGTFEVRGELYLPKNTAYDTGGKPLRNNCVGLVNRKEAREDIRYVKFLAYQIAEQGTNKEIPFSEADKIDLLSREGFDVIPFWRVDSPEEMNDLYQKYVEKLREEWAFETDGLIVTVDDSRLFAEIDNRWVVERFHHYAVAFKPPVEGSVTRLKEIDWQVSRQGVLTPVAVFEPVTIGGAALERASLHNAQNLKRLGLHRGNRIQVERANDVIPYIRENLDKKEGETTDPALLADSCPSCRGPLETVGVALRCLNTQCPGRVLQSILFWVRQGGIEQVAFKTLEALYQAGKLRSIRDLYTLTAEDFKGVEGFGEKKINNFLQQTAAARSLSAADLISRLGIPLAQKKALGRLGIKNLEDFWAFDDQDYVVGRNITAWKEDPENRAFLEQLLEVVEIREEESGPRRGTLCFTGKSPLPRKTLTALLERRGWNVAGSVTKDTMLVVCDDPQGKSTKIKKAREAGIAMMRYEEFFEQEGIKTPGETP